MSKRLAVFLCGAAFFLLSCQLSSIATTEVARQLAAEGVAHEDAIVLKSSQPRTLDPAKTLGGPDGALGHIFSCLVNLDTDLQIQPDLAAGWQVSEDGLVYTFHLRKNAVIHDG